MDFKSIYSFLICYLEVINYLENGLMGKGDLLDMRISFPSNYRYCHFCGWHNLYNKEKIEDCPDCGLKLFKNPRDYVKSREKLHFGCGSAMHDCVDFKVDTDKILRKYTKFEQKMLFTVAINGRDDALYLMCELYGLPACEESYNFLDNRLIEIEKDLEVRLRNLGFLKRLDKN
jgi:hypothetical protein